MTAIICHRDVIVDETSAHDCIIDSSFVIDQEQTSNSTENSHKVLTTRIPDRLSRFLGARPTHAIANNTGIQLRPLLSHRMPSHQDSQDEMSSDTLRTNGNTSGVFSRTDELRVSSSSRDEGVAKASLKAGKYFMYEPVDGGLWSQPQLWIVFCLWL